jgi:flagellum-specific ATP synthase
MVQAGLHVPGADPAIDRALALSPRLDAFFGASEHAGTGASFAALRAILAGAEGEEDAPHAG